MASGLIPQLSSTLLVYDDAVTASAVVTRDASGDIYGRRHYASSTGGIYNSGRANVGYLAITTTHTVGTTGALVCFYSVDTSGGGFTATLPTAVGNSGLRITFKIAVGANAFVIDGSGTETIDGATTKSCSTLYASYTIVSNGANWLCESQIGTWT